MENIVLAITNGMITNQLAIIPGITPEELYNKVNNILYEYGFVDEVNPDMVTMDVLRENFAVLIQKDSHTVINTIRYVAVIRCDKRTFEIGKLKVITSLEKYLDDCHCLDLDIYCLRESKNIEDIVLYSEIRPKFYDPERNFGWDHMGHQRPEQIPKLIEECDDKSCGLILITKPVLVYKDGKYSIDFRRKFKDFRKWKWTNHEGTPDDDTVFWRELPTPPITDEDKQQ